MWRRYDGTDAGRGGERPVVRTACASDGASRPGRAASGRAAETTRSVGTAHTAVDGVWRATTHAAHVAEAASP
jgi:hypothetical protein